MKSIMTAFFLLVSLSVKSHEFDLKVGDVLLQPLHCWSCSLIEAETGSPYSHIGVVIKIDNNEVFVAEAFMKVRVVTLKEYMAKTEKELTVRVMRPKWVSPDLYSVYLRDFDGLPYDSKFTWDDEKIYCSELLNKLFKKVGMYYPMELPMNFQVNREYWARFFRGEIPDGQLGVEPRAYDDINAFDYIGELAK